jgi:hypothetical protein
MRSQSNNTLSSINQEIIMPDSPTEKSERDHKAMNLLVTRGMFAKDFAIRDLVAVAEELDRFRNPAELAAWTFISPNYVYNGDATAIEQQVISR